MTTPTKSLIGQGCKFNSQWWGTIIDEMPSIQAVKIRPCNKRISPLWIKLSKVDLRPWHREAPAKPATP